jgi:hypothetical protein
MGVKIYPVLLIFSLSCRRAESNLARTGLDVNHCSAVTQEHIFNIAVHRMRTMALESLKAEIGLILEMFSNPPHDKYELYVQLKEKLNEMRAFGMPPPADLIEFEEALDKEFAAKRRDFNRPVR